jgi:hypothetical protein
MFGLRHGEWNMPLSFDGGREVHFCVGKGKGTGGKTSLAGLRKERVIKV